MEYHLTIYKSLNGRSTRDNWANTHEFQSEHALDSTAIVTAVNQIVELESRLSHPAVNFMRAVLKDVTTATVGYEPSKVRVLDLGGNGLAPYGTQGTILDLNIALGIKRFSVLGKSGILYLRAGLTEGMTETDSRGATVLTADGRLLVEAQLTNGTTPYFAAGKVPVLMRRIMRDNALLAQIRQVNSLSIAGCILIKRNHRYFDRP